MMKRIFWMIVLGLMLCGTGLAKDVTKNGIEKDYYSNGQLKRETTFREGKMDGVDKYYSQDGKLVSEIFYNHGSWMGQTEYWPNGRVRGEVGLQKNGLQKTKDYFKNGRLQSEFYQRNEHIIGMKVYSPKGRLLSELSPTAKNQFARPAELELVAATLIIDPKTGKVTTKEERRIPSELYEVTYDESGNVLINGLHKKYWSNGNVKSEIPFKDGKMNGVAKEFDENGKVTAKIVYENDKEISRKELNKTELDKSSTPNQAP